MTQKIPKKMSSPRSKGSTVKPPENDVIPILELQQPRTIRNTSETRATFIVNKRQLQKIKDIAYWQRSSIKKVVNLAFNKIIQEHENLNWKTIETSKKAESNTNNQKN